MTAGKALHRSLALGAQLVAALMLAGCPTTPRVSTSTVDRADAALRAGDHAGAAALYERLAMLYIGTINPSAAVRVCEEWLRQEPDAVAPHWVRGRVTTGKGNDPELGKLAVFAGVYKFPARVKCAILPWHAAVAATYSGRDVRSSPCSAR